MSGRLGKVDLTDNSNTDVYTVPTSKVATVNINVCNRSNAIRAIRLAIRQGTLGNSDYIEYETKLPAYGVLERTGLILSAGEVITARSSGANVGVRVHGFLEDA